MWTESRRVYRLAFILFWSVLLCLLFQRYVVSFGIVAEQSMQPTLPDGSSFLINRYVYHFTTPSRGDVVALHSRAYESEELTKRVIGLAGEKVRIRLGKVYVDGHMLKEPYAVGWTGPDLGPITLGADEYFVMGDNRPRSEDSRHFGPVKARNINGKIAPGKLFPFW